MNAKKSPKTRILEGLLVQFGFIWEGFGLAWGVFWSLPWVFRLVLTSRNMSFFQHGPNIGSKKPFGSNLIGFGEAFLYIFIHFACISEARAGFGAPPRGDFF